MMLPLWLFGFLTVSGIGFLVWRRSQDRQVQAAWDELQDTGNNQRFDAEMVADLPEPARRYLLRSIEPGTPLSRSVRLTMVGSIRMSRDGDLLPMQSEELLTAEHGYVWRARIEMGALPIRGHDVYVDGAGRMRWWLAGFVPIVRADGPDVSRSAAGRLLGGTALFLPGMLLPSRGARWEAVDGSTAIVRLEAHGEEAAITLEIDQDGRLERMTVPRWNSDPDIGTVGYLPFVGDEFEDERTFGGYTLPTRFRAGWRLGEEGEFPFFYPVIEGAEYSGARHRPRPAPPASRPADEPEATAR